jgi:hypothetical protein
MLVCRQLSERMDDEYEIPSSYGIDTLKCMSVNVNTVYVYWEVTKETLEKNDALNEALLVKLVEETGAENAELMNFYITDLVSNRFINIHLSNKKIFAVVGALKDGVFVELIRSNSFNTPADTITLSNDELWMNKSDAMDEIIKASYPLGYSHHSSFGIIKELEFLRKHNEIARVSQSVSSFSLASKE